MCMRVCMCVFLFYRMQTTLALAAVYIQAVTFLFVAASIVVADIAFVIIILVFVTNMSLWARGVLHVTSLYMLLIIASCSNVVTI